MEKVKFGILKESFNYLKIAAGVVVPILAGGYAYIDKLNNRIANLELVVQSMSDKKLPENMFSMNTRLEALETWKVTIDDRNTPGKLSEIDRQLLELRLTSNSLEKDVSVLKDKQEDKAKRSNIKFDEHEKRLDKNSENIANIYGILNIKTHRR